MYNLYIDEIFCIASIDFFLYDFEHVILYIECILRMNFD